MEFAKRVESSISISKGKSTKKTFEEITFVMSKELGIPPHELLSYPIPMVLSLMDELKLFYKKKAKAAKRNR